ncbi:carboxypeptidase regulatory-like domain-containing protein [Bradymonas sediminis]|uniref:Uncharacterized protein n=1 Tax=Bradymonas sediminis TaxID=1548548 RepID=A0A2Z4FIQ4_9DELT|nr:carboxypeptidase regulatory-like domain-containing protein [Bradymonas sediminis]AWV88614.1 hypothetical protein DN745_04390 [Bradymonas sediminis]TDP63703.1 hypothetical protein DFR33_110161 [Bradymonas sediminis]
MRSYTSIYAWLFSLLLVASVGCGRDAAEDVCSETDPCPGDLVCVEGACFDPGDGEDGGLEDADDVEDGFVDDAEVDGGPDQPDVIEVACETDRDCPAAQLCAEDLCIDRPECLIDNDCGDDEICLGGSCTYSPECDADSACAEGYECVGGQCFEEVCRGPNDCADGELCDGGECVTPPSVTSCFVASQTLSVSRNQRIPLQAFAMDADGEGLAATFIWTSSDPSVATIAANHQSALGAGGTGSTTLSAQTASGVACEGAIELVGESEVAVGDLRVRIFDEETGAPVVGAEVVIAGQVVTTDATGVAGLDMPDGGYSLSVFAEEYNYITINGLSTADVRIPLSKRAGSGPVGGFTGNFDLSRINSSGDVNLGLAGASIAGGLLNLNLQSLLGEPFMSEVSIPGMGASELPLPGGLVIHGQVFGFDLDIKQKYYATASTGARLGWGLAGKVPGMELFGLIQGGGGAADMLTTLLPLFSRFDHANRPLNLNAMPRVADVNDINGNGDTSDMIPNYDAFPEVALRPGVKQVLASEINVSNFPEMTNGPASVAVLVAGTLLEGPGFVPLGISATADEDEDGRPDNRRLTMAPPYGSLSGGRHAVIAIAFEPSEVGFEDGISLPDEFSVALWNGQSLPGRVALGAFPDASTATLDPAARTLSVQADAGPLFRVRMVGQERSWDVWSVGPAGTQGQFTHEISLPEPTNGREDLMQTGEVFIDAIAAEITMNELVSATGIGLNRAGLVSTRFNRTKLN